MHSSEDNTHNIQHTAPRHAAPAPPSLPCAAAAELSVRCILSPSPFSACACNLSCASLADAMFCLLRGSACSVLLLLDGCLSRRQILMEVCLIGLQVLLTGFGIGARRKKVNNTAHCASKRARVDPVPSAKHNAHRLCSSSCFCASLPLMLPSTSPRSSSRRISLSSRATTRREGQTKRSRQQQRQTKIRVHRCTEAAAYSLTRPTRSRCDCFVLYTLARYACVCSYPDMGSGRYSAKLTMDQWTDFNNAQRAHQNYVRTSNKQQRCADGHRAR